jgi:DNA adenine methylase
MSRKIKDNQSMQEADFAIPKKVRVPVGDPLGTGVRKRRPKTQCKKLFAFYPWVGGKHYVKNWLKDKVPSNYGTYFEPFLGAGSMWLELRPSRCVVNDINPYLPLMFWCLKFHHDRFVQEIDFIADTYDPLKRRGFDQVFALFNSERIVIPTDYTIPPEDVPRMVRRAAQFLYLLKRSHNGNVTLHADGTIKCAYWIVRQRILLCNKALFRAIHDYLVTAQIRFTHGEYEKVIDLCQPNDFVYLDPPYTEKKMKNELYPYHSSVFDHAKFFEQIKNLSRRGVYVAMTNTFHPSIMETFDHKNYNIVHMKNVRGWSKSHVGILYRSDVFVTNYSFASLMEKSRSKYPSSAFEP